MTAPFGDRPATPVEPCPLCAHRRTAALFRPHGRRYRVCGQCRLGFVERADLPDPASEAAHYQTHQNRPDDPRYQAFLGRLIDPLKVHLAPGMTVLDFGCGDGSPVGAMLGELGIRVIEYDPVFRPDRRALDRRYDAIVSSEVIEHFHAPLGQFALLDRLLAPGGWLGVMTEPLEDEVDFGTWWYARDPTHVAFYKPETFAWLASRFGWKWHRVGRTVLLFERR
ncbi:MAG: class I SAM-dependent methyltransferase [Geminicoccaceae bacterium]|nr:class I SAM-dependent methyltransferase [Geminicoccaceae bacterium]